MNVYHYTFKFREPYQIIVDSNIIIKCSDSSYNITNGFNKTIQSENKPMITQCCIQALYDTKNEKAISIAKYFERRKCNHRTPINPQDCIESIVDINGENKHRYIVASQDNELRSKLRQIPGIPLIYINKSSVMVMEQLSDASLKYSQNFENKKLIAGLNDSKAGKQVKRDNEKENDGEDDGKGEGEPVKKKRKGPSGPNPLSIKKKKKTGSENVNEEKKEKKPTRRSKHKKVKDDDDTNKELKEDTNKELNEDKTINDDTNKIEEEIPNNDSNHEPAE
ncbi:uncharacterized protein KGF55_000150 [Candida pseudojiufengensis]|uniref:uncharacterized protein n=1 Tax=Candida pseudojiufengensis TaxID=497109 RepID=UPI0022253DA2|nr:uncharacterized protein KGF55_000150 [Candida pseudojiufengensis]KAI5966741.1 hypothetical protein KGF55_000150 [Candida pseudojiufengensis]